MPNDKPHLVSAATVSAAMGDNKFFLQVPEFTPLKSKLATMKVKLDNKGGCGGCKSRRVQTNLYKDFCTVLLSLNADGITRFKRYLGVKRLMMNTQDPTTGGIKLKML